MEDHERSHGIRTHEGMKKVMAAAAAEGSQFDARQSPSWFVVTIQCLLPMEIWTKIQGTLSCGNFDLGPLVCLSPPISWLVESMFLQVSLVINYDLPTQPDQRIGPSGRFGFAFCSPPSAGQDAYYRFCGSNDCINLS
ncbi:hypothetical protein F3Y22_tig00110557pilonHSYRG00303 [Hibiscus syriacus]|uniref:Uncharacterized protein n=1 Tax=Hibiscus syriacus TaxID=106335 RepID=A0A6A3AB44_HIBSY|nr:hypothetical protein F3Y22_tig00110557pilonHSYRG00303 [Hibiscus syriacus]